MKTLSGVNTVIKVQSFAIKIDEHPQPYRLTGRIEGGSAFLKMEDAKGFLLGETSVVLADSYPGTYCGIWTRVSGLDVQGSNFGVWAQRGDGTWAFT